MPPKCRQCGHQAAADDNFCKECGTPLKRTKRETPVNPLLQLFGKEVELLFHTDDPTGEQIQVIVNPTREEVSRFDGDSIRQNVIIGTTSDNSESAAVILPFIKQSKEYLAEPFDPKVYRDMTPVEMRKEYLRLFDRMMKENVRRMEKIEKNTPPPTKRL